MKKIIPRFSSKQFFAALAIISVLGCGIRLAAGFELLRSYPPVSHPSEQTDMHTYHSLAKQVLDGDYDYGKGFYYQPFYYTVFLPLTFTLFGDRPESVIVTQSMVGAAIVWLVGLTFATVFGRLTGLVAALITCINRFLIFYTPFMLIAVVQSFWLALLAYTCLHAFRSPRPWSWIFAGLVHGMAVITRGNVLIFIPLIMGMMTWQFRRTPRTCLVAALLYTATLCTPQIPFATVNYRAGFGFAGASTAGPAVLALGNTPESPPGGREPVYGAGPMAYPESNQDWVNSTASNQSVFRHIISWIRSEPLAYLELKFRMALLFWHRMEIPNNVAISVMNRPIPAKLVNLPIFLGFFAVGTMALAGMVLSIRRHRHRPEVVFLIGYIVLYGASTIAFYVLARFRLPIVPILCGFGGYLVVTTIKQIYNYHCRRNGLRDITVTATAILVSAVFVGWGYDIYRHTMEASVMRFVRPRGVQLSLRDKWIIKDHGPQSFGGWRPLSLTAAKTIAKSLIVPELPVSVGSAEIRFPLISDTAAELSIGVQVPGESSPIYRRVALTPGFQWISIDVTSLVSNIPSDPVRFELAPAMTNADQIFWLFDSQRWYRRTTVNGDYIAELGEQVFELVIHKGQNHGPDLQIP